MFVGQKVILRQLELTDIDDIMKNWNDLEFRTNTGRATPDSREEKMAFIRKAWELKQEGKGYFFAIVEKQTRRFLGHGSLRLINRVARSADLGIFIYNRADWNQGFGSDAMKVLLDFGFKHINLHRIELGVYPENDRAIHVYKKIGFRKIGRKRQNRFMAGRYRDEILMDKHLIQFCED
jgi:RimJ/RimL family protein N-acetyltransferase